MLALSREHKMKATGSTTTVPRHDVSKLSYFLNCGLKGCGVDIIQDDLVNYSGAHRLSKSRQDAIFKLAYNDFDDDTLIGKTIFPVEDGHPLLKGSMNKFYEIEQVSTLVAAHSSALIAGQETEVAKIMVCNKKWLIQYYYNPINGNMRRIRRIMQEYKKKQEIEELSNLLALLCNT